MVEGLANTGRVITSAAAIMVCVFTSFVLNGDPVVKEFGVGLAVAIAIDSTLVRCLLVPAVMVLLGKRAWWLPRWLDRIVPHISIEGEEYFAKRDAEARRRGQAPACASRACVRLRGDVPAQPAECADPAAHPGGAGGGRRAAGRDARTATPSRRSSSPWPPLTDGLDGYFARSRDSITTFGKLMDPLADKLLIIGALVSLVSLNRLEAWVAMVIIAREVAVTDPPHDRRRARHRDRRQLARQG